MLFVDSKITCFSQRVFRYNTLLSTHLAAIAAPVFLLTDDGDHDLLAREFQPSALHHRLGNLLDITLPL